MLLKDAPTVAKAIKVLDLNDAATNATITKVQIVYYFGNNESHSIAVLPTQTTAWNALMTMLNAYLTNAVTIAQNALTALGVTRG